MFKRCLLVYFALSLLLSQAYVPVFKHTCLAMGREWTKVLKEPNSCCKKRPKDPPVIRVEDDAAEVATLARVPCCEDELKYVGIASLTSTVSYKEDHPGNQYSNTDYSSFPYRLVEAQPCTGMFFQDSHGPPMLRDGITLLKFYQTWRC